MENKEKYIKIKEKSLKNSSIIKTDKKAFISKKTISLITLLFISFNLYSCKYNENNIERTINESNYSVSDIIIDNSVNIYQEMEESGVIYSENITVEDYKKINTLDDRDLYSYYNTLGKKECEKVLVALGYKNWDDFLEKKHFESFSHWVSYEKSRIISGVKKR